MKQLFALTSLVIAGTLMLSAQETSLRAERTLDFRFARAMDIKATVGPVRVSSVEFSDLGKGYGRGGIAGRLRAAAPGVNDSEASTMIRAHFLVENPQPEEWEVAFSLEFLDKAGTIIDRVTKRSTWEGEAKPYDLDHQMLTYVVPMITRVRVKMEARLD